MLEAGLNVNDYFSCEIKESAIKCSKHNNPSIKHIGSVTDIEYIELGIVQRNVNGMPGMKLHRTKIDLFLGGTPCKGISRMNQNQDGLMHKESILFWEYVRVLKEIQKHNPDVAFLLECTHGNKEATSTITKILGVEPLNINSRLVSAQNRPRYYWTNISGVTQPKDLGITTADIFEKQFDLNYITAENRVRWLESISGQKSISRSYTKVNPYPKAGCLTANGHNKWN